MDEVFDSNGDIGGDGGASFGGDPEGEAGSDLGGDLDSGIDTGADMETDIADDLGADLNSDVGDRVDDKTEIAANGSVNEETGDDLNSDDGDGSDENMNSDSSNFDNTGEDIKLEDDIADIDNDLCDNSGREPIEESTDNIDNKPFDELTGSMSEEAADESADSMVEDLTGDPNDDNSSDTEQEQLDNFEDLSDNEEDERVLAIDDAFSNESADFGQFDADILGAEIENTEPPEISNLSHGDKQDRQSENDTTQTKEFTEDPYDEDGSIKPNIEYSTGEYDYRYTTDAQGRITSFQADNLQLTDRENRLPHNSETPDKGEFDHAGHLFGDRFGGSSELDNLVSQDKLLNQADYKAMEYEWARALQNGSHVAVDGNVSYDGTSRRPSSFDLFYTVDGEMYERSFLNRSG